MASLRTAQRRVEVAYDLVCKQRALVDTTRIGSPAHRQASDVLALIEESHFLLSEVHRMQLPFATALAPSAPRDAEIARAETPAVSKINATHDSRRLSIPLVLAFACALIVGVVAVEMADPASMSLQARVLGTSRTVGHLPCRP